MNTGPNPYAAPAAKLDGPEPDRGDAGTRRVLRRGLELLIASEFAILMLGFGPRLFDRVGLSVVATMFYLLWAAGVALSTRPLTGNRSRLLLVARVTLVVAAVAELTALWWAAYEPALADVIRWLGHALSTTASISRAATQCLVLVLLRPVFAGDIRALRTSNVAIWLTALGVVAEQVNSWFWSLVSIDALEEMSAHTGDFTMYRAVVIVMVALLGIAGLVYYLGTLVRARLRCRG